MQRATRMPFSVELGPDLVGAIDVEVLALDPEDLALELLVTHGPC